VTVLGLCVSVHLRDPQKANEGMNHYLLPSEGASNIPSISELARYGVYAMELLINQMLKCRR
jgi:chemotaxis protein CheD|tara:strand:+ start:285 stop:470 length:186 start_codon:yes stop_codon:yes gene_type:complete